MIGLAVFIIRPSITGFTIGIEEEIIPKEIVVEEGDIRVVISGSQKIKHFSVQGITSEDAVNVLNKAIKKSQELAAKKLQQMSGGLGGLLGGGGQ